MKAKRLAWAGPSTSRRNRCLRSPATIETDTPARTPPGCSLSNGLSLRPFEDRAQFAMQGGVDFPPFWAGSQHDLLDQHPQSRSRLGPFVGLGEGGGLLVMLADACGDVGMFYVLANAPKR